MRTECPECRWVSVVDGAGRRRMEMRWDNAGASVVNLPGARAGISSRAA